MPKARYRYNIMLRPEPEGGYTALVPALPGCVTYGRNVKEAREMARDAISGYIASMRKHTDPSTDAAAKQRKNAAQQQPVNRFTAPRAARNQQTKARTRKLEPE